MWSAREVTVTTVRNFQFRTKNSPKWMILESRQRNEVQLNCTLSFIFNFVVRIFNIATFRDSVALSHIGRLTVNSWWPWSVLTRHWRPCDRQFLALLITSPTRLLYDWTLLTFILQCFNMYKLTDCSHLVLLRTDPRALILLETGVKCDL